MAAVLGPTPLEDCALAGGKIFVGGLSRETTTNGLRVYFERFGDISDCVVMRDRSTGAPRGFGFVTYASHVSANRVVQHRHVIDGKEVEAKRAVPRDQEAVMPPPPPQMPQMARPRGFAPGGPMRPPQSILLGARPMAPGPTPFIGHRGGSKKIFVGGLSHETSEGEFVGYFSMYGAVVDVVIMHDPHTRRPRGFGFITYESTEAVDRVCQNKYHEFNGKRVEVKRAIPPDRMPDEDGGGDGGLFGPHGLPQQPPPYGRGGAPMRGAPMRVPPRPNCPGGPSLGGLAPAHPSARPWPAEMPGGALQSEPRPAAPDAPGLCAALSAASTVLDVSMAEPAAPPGARRGGAEARASAARISAFANVGGNFSSATAALSQGLRTTYGEDQQGSAPAPAAAAPQDPAPAQGASREGVSSPQQLQEQLAHLAQQQSLLRSLQQQQLSLQLAQQQSAQTQLQMQMLMQQNAMMQGASSSEQPASEQPQAVAPGGGASAGELMDQLSRMAVAPGQASNAPPQLEQLLTAPPAEQGAPNAPHGTGGFASGF